MITQFAAAAVLFLTAMLFGGLMLFAAVVTPAAFKSLDKRSTTHYLQVLFPRYYLWSFIIAAVAAIFATLITLPVAVITSAIAAAALFGRQWLLPRIEQLRPAVAGGDTAAQRAFRRMHAFSVAIHLGQTVLLLVVFVLTWRTL